MLDATPRSQFDIFPWDSNFEIGIAVVDRQHRHLVKLLNELAESYMHDGREAELERIISALIDYASYHFRTEEALWAELPEDDALLAGHITAHNSFVDQVRTMQARLKTDDRNALLEDLLAFLLTWLIHHILYEDKHFAVVLMQVRKGMALQAAKQHANTVMAAQASLLSQRVLAMYKELSTRTFALEREAYFRQQAEQALLEQEQQWNSVLAAGSDNLWDLEFPSTAARRPEQLLSAEQFAKNDFKVHPDDWPRLQQELLKHMLGEQEVFLHLYRVIDTEGNERWIQSRGKVIEADAAGRPRRILGTQTDVTERKTAELTLQRERDTRMLISEFAADFMASSGADFDNAINHALQRSCEYMQADRSYVFLMSADGRTISNTHEWCAAGIAAEIDNLQNIPVADLSWWLSQLREVGYIQVRSITDMPAAAQHEYYLLELQSIRSLYVYPLYADQQLIGFMGSDSVHEERHWSSESIEFLNLMGDLLGIALGHRELQEKREQAIHQLERAEAIAQLGRWRIEYASDLAICSQEALRIFEYDSPELTLDAQTYLAFVHPHDRVALLEAYNAAKAERGELHLEHRIMLDGGRIKHLEVLGRFASSADNSPIMAEGTIQDVTEKVEQRDALQRLAYQDDLTGLPNRRSLEESLWQEMKYCASHGCRLLLALLDLDNFHEANDQYGAALGDALLKALAQRLQRLFGDKATIARVGGDEFVVLFSRLQIDADDRHLQRLSQLLEAISEPLTVEGVKFFLTASAGVTEYPQPTEIVAEQLIRQAQQALFQAKMLGKRRLQKYDLDSEQDARELTDHLEKISQALENNELVLYYQPKVNMSSGHAFGAEALLRWQKSDGELVPPGEFLPALHDQSLEIEIGDWVIRSALAQMRLWKQQGLDIQVSINVSSQQLFADDFVEKLSADLQSYPDLDPASLQLEVLESSMLRDLEAVSAVMHRCGKLGVGFALDDFGTGYSSLAYLKYLPAGVLKIDRSFIQEMLESTDDLSIISGVIGMANAFGMRVIAEGVETIEQGEMLLRLGCEHGQGYGIARPMPAQDIPDWIRQWRAVPSWAEQSLIEAQNLPLLYAEVEHRSWVTKLENCLQAGGEPAPLLEHWQCQVSTWLAKDAQSRFRDHPQLPRLLSLHEQLHSLGNQAITQQASGQSAAAQALLPKITKQRDLFLAELKSLTR